MAPVRPHNPPEIELPNGWKLKNIVGLGARSNKIVYYESPSGYLYRSPESVLSHMRTSGLYTTEQIEEFEQEVSDFEVRKIAMGHHGQGIKRKSEEIHENTSILDSQKVSSEKSSDSVKRFKNEKEGVENFKSCKISLPRLTRKELDRPNDSEVGRIVGHTIKTESIGFKLEDMNLKHKTFVEVFDESYIPEGWKVVDIPHYMPQNEGTTVTMRRFVTPKGITYSRTQACGALEKQKDTVNFEIMRKGLLAEGWMQNDQFPIPDRFYCKRSQGSTQGIQFVTPEWKIIKGMKKYKEYLEKHNFDQKYVDDIKVMSMRKQDIEKRVEKKGHSTLETEELANSEENHFTDIYKQIIESEGGPDNKKSRIEDIDDDASFPEGWKVNKLHSDTDLVVISSPNGSKFSSRRHALEFMLKSRGNPAFIFKVWRTLSKEGWQEGGNLLPVGWRVFQSGKVCKFLNREMKVLVNEDEALKHLQSDKSYSDTEVKNFVDWTSKSLKISWNFHPDLPDGWKMSECLPYKYMNPSRNIFEDKIAALEHIISEQYKPELIYNLWISLGDDGWKLDRNLPTGWRRKTVPSSEIFLSPMMQVFNDMEELSEYISSSKEFTQQEVLKFKVQISNKKIRSI